MRAIEPQNSFLTTTIMLTHFIQNLIQHMMYKYPRETGAFYVQRISLTNEYDAK